MRLIAASAVLAVTALAACPSDDSPPIADGDSLIVAVADVDNLGANVPQNPTTDLGVPGDPDTGNSPVPTAAVDLDSDSCAVPSQGQVAGWLSGALSRQIDRDSRGALAKIFRHPSGGWALQLNSREPGRDFSLLVPFSDAPVRGGAVRATARGTPDPLTAIGGGANMSDRDPGNHVGWYTGTVTIIFTSVRPQLGKPFTWVCGTITADLVGRKRPPPGAYTPIEIPATFTGNFWAEWYPLR